VVIANPTDYSKVLNEMKSGEGAVTL
jgi:hypothetical protein